MCASIRSPDATPTECAHVHKPFCTHTDAIACACTQRDACMHICPCVHMHTCRRMFTHVCQCTNAPERIKSLPCIRNHIDNISGPGRAAAAGYPEAMARTPISSHSPATPRNVPAGLPNSQPANVICPASVACSRAQSVRGNQRQLYRDKHPASCLLQCSASQAC